jgi:Domain of unknown function (DUF4386)
MIPFKNPGRFVGLIYVLVSIGGLFSLVYVPGKIFVHGDAIATASNIAARETLFRFGIACNLVFQILFMWVALALYDLLKGVSRRQALLMFGLIAAPLPVLLMNELNSIAALLLVRGAGFLSVLEKPQRNALAMMFLNLHDRGFDIAGIFWGLWLFPLGLLVYRSGFIPRILGIILMVSCFAYIIDSLVPIAVPRYQTVISPWMGVLRAGELLFMLWLLIMGAKPKPLPPPASAAP